MKKAKPIFVVSTKTKAILTAKQGLKLNDKTMRLKNVVVQETTFKCKGKCGIQPAITVIADTDMQNNAVMQVGICKTHAIKFN